MWVDARTMTQIHGFYSTRPTEGSTAYAATREDRRMF